MYEAKGWIGLPDGADDDAEELGVDAAVRLAEVNATGCEMGQGL